MTIDNLRLEFEKNFNKPAQHIFFCPGRVNLIGEHIDYNGGMVMPCAITMGTTLLVAKNDDNIFRFRAVDFPKQQMFHNKAATAKRGMSGLIIR
ncbi:hypothetical protein LWM68_11470 [Niabella sp. W65]|nr:hypothetical protein [Niabella sp. W65]MCH7363318.1 hypothetical protein [Niabella sp. W65]ULT39245.1 hypothetical protein KRR40_30215 [Niabella sp. I65]